MNPTSCPINANGVRRHAAAPIPRTVSIDASDLTRREARIATPITLLFIAAVSYYGTECRGKFCGIDRINSKQ